MTRLVVSLSHRIIEIGLSEHGLTETCRPSHRLVVWTDGNVPTRACLFGTYKIIEIGLSVRMFFVFCNL